MTRNQVKMSLLGLAYGLILVVAGAFVSGGGHFMFLVALALAPVPFGIVFWPLFGYLSATLDNPVARATMIATLMAHYLSVLFYVVSDSGSSDGRWYTIGAQDPVFAVVVFAIGGVYVAGQFYLLAKLVRSMFG